MIHRAVIAAGHGPPGGQISVMVARHPPPDAGFRVRQNVQSCLKPKITEADLHPAVWQRAADLTARVESALIRLIASKSKLLAKSLERKVRQMKADLAGDSSSPLERGVIERIVACWLQVQFAEVASVEHADDREANSWQKRLGQAQRRYLSAVNCLAMVRKLLAE